MKLVTHLLRNDLRRFRGLIVIWIGLVAAGVALYAVSPTLAGESRPFTAAQTAGGLLWLARQLFRAILVALIVQADPTVGSTAFWMTRPVSPTVLFVSKVLLIFGLTVGVPAAGDLVLGLVYHVPVRDIAIAMIQTALVGGAWTAAMMTIAVPTRSLSQFAAVCGVAILSAVVGLIGLVAAIPTPGSLGRSNASSDPLIPVVAGVLFGSFLAAAWLVQYVRRNRRESLPVVVAGACLAIGFATIAEPPLVARELDSPPSWARAATLRLPPVPPDIYSGSEVVTSGIQGGPTSLAVARARVVLPELPAGWLATALLRGATVVAGGGTLTCGTPPFQASVNLSRETGHNRNASEIAAAEALGVPDVMNLQSYGADATTLFFVPYADVDRVGEVHGTYRGSFRLGLLRVETVGSLPLSAGATSQDGASRVTIADVLLDDELVSIRLERSSVPRILPNRRTRYDFYLRNRAKGQALRGSIRQGLVNYLWVSAFAHLADAAPGVNRWAEFLTFRGGAMVGKPAALTREWLDRADLVVVRTTNAGAVERELVVDDFRWEPPSKQ